MKYKSLLILSSTLFLSVTSYAKNLYLTCPPQEFALEKIESQYAFITGLASIKWQDKDNQVLVRGHFLYPGTPDNYVLSTQKVRVAIATDKRELTFYCDLANKEQDIVAYAGTSITMQQLGAAGIVKECWVGKSTTVCNIE